MNALPLAGRRVLVTRAAHQAGKLSEGLRALGAEPVEVPVIEIQPPLDFAPLDRALRELDSYDWLILTSANTVRALAKRAAKLGLSLAAATHLNISAIGEATAEATRQAGLAVALVPESYVAESLTRSLAVQTCGKKVLLARAAVARDVIPHALRAAGATVDVVDAYRNVIPSSAPSSCTKLCKRESMRRPLPAHPASRISPTPRVTLESHSPSPASRPFPSAPSPARLCANLAGRSAAEAEPSDVSGLIQAVATHSA